MAGHRRRYLLAAGVLLVGTALAILLSGRSSDRVKRTNAAKIENGMTLSEVERLLGGPAGDYGTPDLRYGLFGPKELTAVVYGTSIRPRAGAYGSKKVWYGEAFRVEVYFDAEDKVCFFCYGGMTRGRTTPRQALTNLLTDTRTWLGL